VLEFSKQLVAALWRVLEEGQEDERKLARHEELIPFRITNYTGTYYELQTSSAGEFGRLPPVDVGGGTPVTAKTNFSLTFKWA
jgi:hypothetical protein